MVSDLSDEVSVLGRSDEKIEKYGSKGTAYMGKSVLSSGQKPVLGRKVVIDIAEPHVMLICGKRGGGKCVTGDTLITLEDGSVLPIKDLENDGKKIVSLDQNYKLMKKEKTNFFKRIVSKILAVKLRSGKEIKLTPEHPLLTLDGWRPVQELQKGSRIATPRIIPVFGNGFLKESQIKILAYLIAEGHMKRHAVYFSNLDKKLIEEFIFSVKDFDSNLLVNQSPVNNWRVVFNGKKHNMHSLKIWLKKLGLHGLLSNEKFIPQEIFTLPKQKISIFLNRLFSGDGTIYFDTDTESWRVAYASKSERLIRQVQHLLLRFEILSTLRQKTTKSSGKEFKSFELELKGINVQKFLTEIGFFGEKELKQEKALKDLVSMKRNPNIDTIPKEIWKTYKPQSWAAVGRTMNYKFPKALRESMFYAPSRQKLLQIAKGDNNKLIELLATSDIYWDEIKEIKVLEGEFEVFDLSVPENHNFVANDIIVHNSFTLAVLLEELARQPFEVRQRLSVIAIDTVGIFWTLKIPNQRDIKELEKWDLKPDKTNVKVLVPKGRKAFYDEKGIPVDGAFTIKTSELEEVEWLSLFKLTWREPEGILLSRVIENLKETMGTRYSFPEIISAIQKDVDSEKLAKQALINRFRAAESWGLFEKEGFKLRDIAKPGEITIIDVSSYRQTMGMEGTRDIVVGLLGKKLFEERMLFRKEEEVKLIKGEKRESSMPLVWLLIDEAHMFMPKDEENIALSVLLEWVRVGRQPGLSLVLATQRPEKLHPDAISQCDIFISHRMTAQPDIQAVSALRPSYMHEDFDKYYQRMPRAKGFALVLDDNTEKIWMVKIRPRFSWDGGVTATAFKD